MCPLNSILSSGVGAVNQRDREEVYSIQQRDIPLLLESLPLVGYRAVEFKRTNEKWIFLFTFTSISRNFAACGDGATPRAAFNAGKEKIERQIRDWHATREKMPPVRIVIDEPVNIDGIGDPNTDATAEALTVTPRLPEILIIDDDVDNAHMLEAAFRRLGCRPRVLTDINDLHRKLVAQKSDFVVLDWRLSETLIGGQALERAARLIETFSDLKAEFSTSRPQVITYSVLPASEIEFPKTEYFRHLDHWQKPISLQELRKRTAEVVNSGH